MQDCRYMWKSWHDLCSYMIKNSSFPGEFHQQGFQTFPEKHSVKFSLLMLICLLNKIEKRIYISVLLGKSFNLTLFDTLLITSTYCRDKAPTPFPLTNNVIRSTGLKSNEIFPDRTQTVRRVSRVSLSDEKSKRLHIEIYWLYWLDLTIERYFMCLILLFYHQQDHFHSIFSKEWEVR